MQTFAILHCMFLYKAQFALIQPNWPLSERLAPLPLARETIDNPSSLCEHGEKSNELYGNLTNHF